MAKPSPHFQAVTAFFAGSADGGEPLSARLGRGGGGGVAAVILSWPDGPGEEGAMDAWAGLLGTRLMASREVLAAMEQRFGKSVWSLPATGAAIVDCARCVVQRPDRWDSQAEEASEGFCFGAERLDDALWRDPANRERLVACACRWLRREGGNSPRAVACLQAFFRKDRAAFGGVPPSEDSLARAGGLDWLAARPYWQWLLHREDVEAWRLGGHASGEGGWPGGEDGILAGEYLARHAPMLARAVARCEGLPAAAAGPDFSTYAEAFNKTIERGSKATADEYLRVLGAHPKWRDYRDPATGHPAVLLVAGRSPAALRRMLLARGGAEAAFGEAMGDTGRYGLGLWEVLAVRFPGGSDACEKLVSNGIAGVPLRGILQQRVPAPKGWLARAVLHGVGDYSYMASNGRRVLGDLIGTQATAEELFGGKRLVAVLAGAARRNSRVAMGTGNACVAAHGASPGSVPGEVLLAALAGTAKACASDKRQHGSEALLQDLAASVMEALGAGHLRLGEACVGYGVERVIDDIGKAREAIARADRKNGPMVDTRTWEIEAALAAEWARQQLCAARTHSGSRRRA